MFQGKDYVQGGRTQVTEIAGRDRFKFFRRPVVPSIEGQGATQLPLALAGNRPTIQRAQALQPRSQILQTDAQGSVVVPNSKPRVLQQLSSKKSAAAQQDEGQEEESRDMGCQTLMRENDCQTDPYTPDYFLEDGAKPEVLDLKDLRWGEGLPAKKGEIEYIDRVQRRKNVENNLPQGNDDESMKQRLQALEKLEKGEWEDREAHIEQFQAARLSQIDDALQRREAKREEESATRVERMKQAKLMEVEQKLQKMQEKRLVSTRQLTTKHVNPCAETHKREIISAHATYGPRSKPVANSSLIEKVSTINYDVRPTLLSFPEGVQELEKTKAPKLETVKEEKMIPPKDKAINSLPTNFQKRKAHTVVEHLEYASTVIEEKKKTKQKAISVQELYRATPRLQRPDTPKLTVAGDEDEAQTEAVLLLQRLLRGRALQNDFFEGKERCHGLIEELQAASSAKDSEQWWLPEQQKEEAQKRQEEAAQAVIDEAQGDIVFGTMDYLFKELLRAQEAAKVDRLRQLAEATRAEREAAERARRAEERQDREKEEEQYAAVVRAVDAGVETFLDQMLTSTVRNVSLAQALDEQLRPKPNETKLLETDLDKEDYVCEMLDQFVIPAVCQAIREKKDSDERPRAVAEAAVFAAKAAVDQSA